MPAFLLTSFMEAPYEWDQTESGKGKVQQQTRKSVTKCVSTKISSEPVEIDARGEYFWDF